MHPLQSYLDAISFRFVQPETAVPSSRWATAGLYGLRRIGLDLEALNTVLPRQGRAITSGLEKLAAIPKASSLANGAIIQKCVSLMNPAHAFVNVGVWHGFTFLCGLLGNDDKRCIGVDKFCVRHKVTGNGKPSFNWLQRLYYGQVDDLARRSFLRRFDRAKSSEHHFYEMDYADYFRHVHAGPIGVYIYDAQHRYRDQLVGLQLAEPFFADGCIVFIDDTNAPDNRRATLDFIEHSEHEYELLFDQRTYGNRHPTLWNGVMIFQKAKPQK